MPVPGRGHSGRSRGRPKGSNSGSKSTGKGRSRKSTAGSAAAMAGAKAGAAAASAAAYAAYGYNVSKGRSTCDSGTSHILTSPVWPPSSLCLLKWGLDALWNYTVLPLLCQHRAIQWSFSQQPFICWSITRWGRAISSPLCHVCKALCW